MAECRRRQRCQPDAVACQLSSCCSGVLRGASQDRPHGDEGLHRGRRAAARPAVSVIQPQPTLAVVTMTAGAAQAASAAIRTLRLGS